MYDVEYCQCFKCGQRLENLSASFGNLGFQPLGGTCFGTYGHYGSTVFDPVDGSKLEIVICDECLEPLIGEVNKELLYESWAEESIWNTLEDE